jgi:hypothetical protein
MVLERMEDIDHHVDEPGTVTGGVGDLQKPIGLPSQRFPLTDPAMPIPAAVAGVLRVRARAG